MTLPPEAPGSPPAEVTISGEIVGQLIAEQFPALASLPLDFVASGWDNSTYRLGQELAVRLPRIRIAVDLLVKEQRFLPRLAPLVEIPVPAPVHIGAPSARYPWTFSIVPWQPGEDGTVTPLLGSEATKLGRFLKTLHGADPTGLGTIAWRGGPLAERANDVGERLEVLRRLAPALSVDLAEVQRRFDCALAEPMDAPKCWIHGDLHPKNLVSDRGRLVSVIDWGDMNLGDPANDLACVWALFEPEHHDAFWDAYGTVSLPTRERAVGWAIFFGVTLLASGLAHHPEFIAPGTLILRRLFAM